MATTTRTSSRQLVGALCLAIGLTAAPAAAAEGPRNSRSDPRVQIIDLGIVPADPVGTGAEAAATHISDSGVVFGHAGGLEPPRFFRWDDGAVAWLDLLGYESARIEEVNARADAAVTLLTLDGPPDAAPSRAVLWAGDGTLVSLGVPGVNSVAYDVNDRGAVAGATQTEEFGFLNAAVWRRDGRVRLLEDPGAEDSEATAINDRGEAVGTITQADGSQHAVRWDRRGRVTVFEPPVPETRRSVAVDINHRGEVLVWTFSLDDDVSEIVERWYVWDGDEATELPIDFQRTVQPVTPFWGHREDVYGAQPFGGAFIGRAVRLDDGEVTELGVLSGGESTVTAVNRRGQAVGGATLADPPPDSVIRQRAVLFDDGQVIDLGTLPGGESSFAYDINKHGRIVGTSWDGGEDGFAHAVMWTLRR